MSTTNPPTNTTDEYYPNWQDIVHTWRAVDAAWLRDRLVHVFDNTTERDAVITASRQGMMAYLKDGETSTTTGCGLTFHTAAGWETVRYPNLRVDSDSTSVTLKRLPAGSGISLKTDGSAEIAKLFAGAGGIGTTLDNTGISLKVGTKTVKLSTDATQLTVDSPLRVTGDIESTAALKGVSATLTGNLNAVNTTLTGTLTAPSGSFTHATTPTTAAIFRAGGDAEIALDTSLAVFRNRQSTANRLSFSSTGAAVLTGATVAINGVLTVNNAATMAGAVTFTNTTTPVLAPSGMTAAPVAGVIAMNRAPTGSDNHPNGTIWFQV